MGLKFRTNLPTAANVPNITTIIIMTAQFLLIFQKIHVAQAFNIVKT